MNRQAAFEIRTAHAECCSQGFLVPVDQAIARAVELATGLGATQNVTLSSALGRICHLDIKARLPLPNFDNSAMDGYAVNTSTLSATGPYRLKITGRMAAGDIDLPDTATSPSDALRILTGARVPVGYDAVIMQEFCRVENGYIVFDPCPAAGKNIREKGEDCSQGEILIPRGTRLAPRHISLIAAQGYDTIEVVRKVRIAIFSTGSELRLPGETLAAGQIYNSNRYTLAAQLDRPCVEIIDLGSIKDEPELLKAAMKSAVATADMIITTGGVSVGDEDHMADIVTDLGGVLHVHKIGIRPGKPVIIGTLGKVMYLGLPGNPVAAYLNQMLIGNAIIASLSGADYEPLAAYPVMAQFSCKSSAALQEYIPVRMTERTKTGMAIVQAFEKVGSAALVSLAQSDGFIILPAGISEVKPGDTLNFIPH